MSKILLTIHLSQDVEDEPHGDKGWQRQFWVKTKMDLAAAFDTVEEEAHQLFTFEKTGVTETFNKNNVRTHLDKEEGNV